MAINFNTISPWKDRKRVALDTDGSIAGIHDASDTDKWASPGDVDSSLVDTDEESVDWSAYESAGLNCMVQVPKFWYKQWKDTDGWHFRISPKPQTGFSLHPAFLDSSGDEKDYYYLSAFEGWVDGNSELRSLPNKQPSTSTNVTGTLTAFQGYASNIGTGWGLWNWDILWAEQLQFFIEIGTLYSQDVYLGITNLTSGSGNHSQNTGHTCSLGNASGEVSISATNGVSGTTYPFSFRGVENLYGNIWKWVDGFTRYPSGSDVGKVDIVSGGTTTRYDLEDAGTSHIYPTNFEGDIPGMMGKSTSAVDYSDSTYLTDYMYRSGNSDRKCLFGGSWLIGGQAGALCLALHFPASYSNRSFGGRAAYLN